MLQQVTNHCQTCSQFADDVPERIGEESTEGCRQLQLHRLSRHIETMAYSEVRKCIGEVGTGDSLVSRSAVDHNLYLHHRVLVVCRVNLD